MVIEGEVADKQQIQPDSSPSACFTIFQSCFIMFPSSFILLCFLILSYTDNFIF